MHTHLPKGTCSTKIEFDLDGDIIRNVHFTNGCDGNAQGISRLVEGMRADEVMERLKGIQCRNGTSCPDQLAIAIKNAMR